MVPEAVFRRSRPFHGPRFDAVYAQVMGDETGRRILREGRSLLPVLLDRDRLRSLPGGSLGGEYVRFVEENEVDVVGFAEASLRHMAREDYATDEAWALANRMRDVHDLVHVVSGYGTDLLGEMCTLAFGIRQDPRSTAAERPAPDGGTGAPTGAHHRSRLLRCCSRKKRETQRVEGITSL